MINVLSRLLTVAFAVFLITVVVWAATWRVSVLVDGKEVFNKGGYSSFATADAAGRTAALKYLRPGSVIDVRVTRQGNGEAGPPKKRR